MKILYVEDNPSHRDMLKQTLELAGYDVVLANDGAEGIEKAKEEFPDVIIMDLRMPNVDGIDAIKILKKDPAVSNIPIIALSAWTSKKYYKGVLKIGAASYFMKPVDFNHLINEIRRLGKQRNETTE